MGAETIPRIVIVAYGNPLRSDDGVGWHLAQLMQSGSSDCVTELICIHQLTPEIAEKVANADGVIFIDASLIGEPGQIRCTPVEANESGELLSHFLSPGQVLALSEQLYERRPGAFIVSVAAESFDHGNALSKTLHGALPALVETVENLIVHMTLQSRR